MSVRPEDLTRWRNALGLSQIKAAAIFQRSDFWWADREMGRKGVPRWLVYAMGWTRLKGLTVPLTQEEMPERIAVLRVRWGLTMQEQADLFGVDKPTLNDITQGRRYHTGIAFACAWVDFFGSDLPFHAVGIEKLICPHCGKQL